VTTPRPSDVEDRVHYAVNNVRDAHGLPPLQWDEKLARIARSHSSDMASRNFVGHSTPTGTGLGERYRRFDYDDRVPDDGRNALLAGENIAKLHVGIPSKRIDGKTVTYETVFDLGHGAVHGWMNSAGHRENLLRHRWQREGIGVVIDHHTVYITQNFF